MKEYIDKIYELNRYDDLKDEIAQLVLSYFFYNEQTAFEAMLRNSTKKYMFFEFAIDNQVDWLIAEMSKLDWSNIEIGKLFKKAISNNLYESFVELGRHYVLQAEIAYLALIENLHSPLNETFEFMFHIYNEMFTKTTANLLPTSSSQTFLDVCRLAKNYDFIARLQQHPEESKTHHPLLVRAFSKIDFFQPGIIIWSNF